MHEIKQTELDRALEPLWRLRSSIPNPKWSSFKQGGRRYWLDRRLEDLERYLIVFCGRAYGVYTYRELCSDRTDVFVHPEAILDYFAAKLGKNTSPHVTFPKDAIKQVRNSKSMEKQWHEREDAYPGNAWGWTKWTDEKQAAGAFDVSPDVHRLVGAPVFMLSFENLLVVNPRLADFNFAKLVDPWIAYQELSMYVGSALVEQKDPNENITDDIRAHNHGFGHKYAFRKEPQK